jgi:hypothetical protein
VVEAGFRRRDRAQALDCSGFAAPDLGLALFLLNIVAVLILKTTKSLAWICGFSGNQKKKGSDLMMFEKKKRYTTPRTLDEAADLLIADLPPEYQDLLTKMSEEDFNRLYDSVGGYILDDFKLWLGNEALLVSCYRESGEPEDTSDPARIILNRVREKLQETAGLLIVF